MLHNAHTPTVAIEFSHCTIIFGTKKNVISIDIDMYDIVSSYLLAVLVLSHHAAPSMAWLQWRVTCEFSMQYSRHFRGNDRTFSLHIEKSTSNIFRINE